MLRLIRNFYLFRRYPIAKEFVKFCLVGFTNLGVDILIYFILTRQFGIHYILAAIMSFAVAVTWSFFVNRRWTFHHNGSDVGNQYIKFFIANSVSMGVHLFLLFIFVDIFNIDDLLSKFVISVIVAFLNFGINKFWTFSNIEKKGEINNGEES